MEKKQTAVEWLIKRFEDGDMYNVEDVQFIKHQAKEMEKEQIEHAYKTCWQDYTYGGKHWEMGMDPNETFKSYYNETYVK